MPKTPEGEVKDLVRELLDGFKGMWYYMPVPSGYGRQSIDFIGCFRGHGFGVETKADKGVVSRRQEETMRAMRNGGAHVFLVEGTQPWAISDLEDWLLEIERTVKYVPVEDPPTTRRIV